jgi:hypothetical protein
MPEMSMGAANVPLPRRGDKKRKHTAPRWQKKKSYRTAAAPRRCRDGFQKNVPNFTVVTALD